MFRKKEITIGSWITFSDPAIAEIMAKSGFDWLVVDMEHSALSMNQAQEIIRIINLCNVIPLVRVMENNPNLINRFMDIGAHGVIIPMVNSKSDAERAVNAVKYPPMGTRGVGLSRAQNYSLDLESYQEWNQKNSIVIVQIEHIKGVENLQSIIDVDGIEHIILEGGINILSKISGILIEINDDFKDQAASSKFLLEEAGLSLKEKRHSEMIDKSATYRKVYNQIWVRESNVQ